MNTKIKTEERICRLVACLGKETKPRRELMAELGLRESSRRNFRVNYINPAIEQGYVRMTIPGAPSCPEQAMSLLKTDLISLQNYHKT